MPTLTETADFDIPFAADDAVIECGACDPEYGEPAEWPEWVDDDRWEPSEEDSAWAAQHVTLPPVDDSPEPEPFEPTDADWDDLYAASYGMGDDDLTATGLAVG